MLLLLPPSETKRPGGEGAPVDLGGLALPSLAPLRERCVDALVGLSADPEAAARVLRLGPTQAEEVVLNAALRTAPTLPAVDRYAGVLFDALDARGLAPAARRWLHAHVLVHSAPFGPVGALDPIPAYRLPAGASVPGLPPLRRLWADAVTAALAERAEGYVLDLRSEAYVALGPLAAGTASAFLRVVAEGADGRVRALNHFNKHAKGAFVRALAEDRPTVRADGDLLRWARRRGFALERADERTMTLLVS